MIPSEQDLATFADVDSLQQAVADAFCQVVIQAVKQRGTAKVSLSGGSTPKRLYQLLADRDLPWQAIHWFWGDERNVIPSDPESNQRMVREALLDRVGVDESKIHAVPVLVDAPQEAAQQYEQVLRDHFPGDEFPRWDLALLGMGDDAHTASLFPETRALQERSRWFVENWVEKLNAFRYTLTAPAINSARHAWFLVTGSAKRDALKQVWQGPNQPERYPSQLIHATRWYVTEDAIVQA